MFVRLSWMRKRDSSAASPQMDGVIVTGGTSGNRRDVALRLVVQGSSVLLADGRPASPVNATGRRGT